MASRNTAAPAGTRSAATGRRARRGGSQTVPCLIVLILHRALEVVGARPLAAERMRRYRARKKEIKIVNDATLTQARNRRKRLTHERNPLAQWRHRAINAQLEISVLQARLRAFEAAPDRLDKTSEADGLADELARQIAEALQVEASMTINDVRDAIDRRFGPDKRSPAIRSAKPDPLAKYLYPTLTRPKP